MLIWGSIENTLEAEKILHGTTPVNVLAAETGAEAIPLLVMAEDEEEAMFEGAALVNEYVKKEGLGLLGYGALCDDELVVAAMAGGILQAAALKVGIMLDGIVLVRLRQKLQSFVLMSSSIALLDMFLMKQALKKH